MKVPLLIAAYISVGILAHLVCERFLRQRDPKMAADISPAIYAFFGDPLAFIAILFWPIYLTGAIILAVKFPDPESMPQAHSHTNETTVGQKGTAVGALAPSGKVRIGDDLRDALSVDGVIEDGHVIVVVGEDSLALKVANG